MLDDDLGRRTRDKQRLRPRLHDRLARSVVCEGAGRCSYLLRELSERRSDPAGLRDSGTSSGREASGPGTTATRLLEFGPNTPWKRTGCRRGKAKGLQPPFNTAELQALQWSGRL